MNYRRVGRYGLKVSEVGLGNWLTQGRTISDETTSAIVRRALDLGINFFDTADIYGKGAAELALARALGGVRREDLVVATKCFFPMSDNPNDGGLSRKHITESVHNSLKRLNTDYVDIFQFHRFDENTPIDESIGAVDDLIRQGKVLYWGVSMWTPEQIREAVEICEDMGATFPISNQPEYSMLARSIESGVIATCEELGMGQVVFSPLAQGVLTGKYLPGQPAPAGTRASDESSNWAMQDELKEETLRNVQRLRNYVESQGFVLAQFALAWCLRQTNVSAVIAGATKVEQLESNAGASGLQVPPEVFAKAEELLSGANV